MGVHRGGKKRAWKIKGRLPVYKMFQRYKFEQIKHGQINMDNGAWKSVDQAGTPHQTYYRAEGWC